MPYYDPTKIQDDVKAMLDAANVTSASICLFASMTSGIPVQTVNTGKPKWSSPIMAAYPAIWVYLEDDTEDWSELGQSAKRYETLRLGIVCAAQAGPISAHGEGERQAAQLIGNVRSILRANPSLSGSVLYIKPTGARYNDQPEGSANDGTYVTSHTLMVEARTMLA